MKKLFTFFFICLTVLLNAKQYKGAEIYSSESFLYGKFEMKIKAAKGSGQLSTFFLYKNGSELNSKLWQEIDIEIFGKSTTRFQTNIIIEKQEGSLLTTEKKHTMGFDMSEDFHTFVVEWTPDSICWYVDSVLIRSEKEFAKSCTEPMSIRFNHWAANNVGWVGSFDTSVLPSYQYVDYIKYYSYNDTATSKDSIFNLEWEDDFSTFETSRWSKANWTFGENLVDFLPANAYIENDVLVLKLHDTNPPEPVGLEEVTSQCGVYPNPFVGTPNIKNALSTDVEFTVLSIQGQVLISSKSESETAALLSELNSGQYIFNWSSEKLTGSQLIIKND